jgi:hypothetical protein
LLSTYNALVRAVEKHRCLWCFFVHASLQVSRTLPVDYVHFFKRELFDLFAAKGTPWNPGFSSFKPDILSDWRPWRVCGAKVILRSLEPAVATVPGRPGVLKSYPYNLGKDINNYHDWGWLKSHKNAADLLDGLWTSVEFTLGNRKHFGTTENEHIQKSQKPGFSGVSSVGIAVMSRNLGYPALPTLLESVWSPGCRGNFWRDLHGWDDSGWPGASHWM